MHATVVTNVGLLVDAVIVERCLDEGELIQQEMHTISSLESGRRPSHSVTPVCSTMFSARSGSICSAATIHSPLSTTLCGMNNALLFKHGACTGGATRTATGADSQQCTMQSVIDDDVHYECRAVKRPLPQRVFHLFDVLPFGLMAPSSVFSVVGRHTNRGLVVGVTVDGLYMVRPYESERPLQLVGYNTKPKKAQLEYLDKISKISSSPAVLGEIASFMEVAQHVTQLKKKYVEKNEESSESLKISGPDNQPPYDPDSGKAEETGSDDDSSDDHGSSASDSSSSSTYTFVGMEFWALKDLQLPPQLAVHDPVPPLRVGSRVVARRFACGETLHIARVCAVSYDVSYTLRYESDNAVDVGVLHNDVHLLDDSEAEQCTVRDSVIIALHKQVKAMIIECCGNENYRVILDENPGHALEITRRHIVFITPLLKEALYADPQILQWFRDLDHSGTGVVMWKDVRHFILEWETFGKQLSFQKLGEVQRDLCIRKGHVESQLMKKVPMQQEDMLLRYPEFEYIMLRVGNML
ncbi:hypothetical protein ERJ75_001458400 [Trypanosoma vivax]|uniref:EF-hand domain-containing protein n=1 Tax=Trypanosoma vivax (strain Y486) TaxID=1055687 RepID=G0TVZ1_TRYVY|nr:hypothetical protein ERJ75_001458400 [Trypanosoma vivax]CCC48107.1 conserved hypothetical protein [Trypanosoma vivax Y486]